ncbi:hypothetical protein ACERK3_16295 [Phycisphaerales bacterium AB-hyl4]|uniref:Uncharacterized protein n=1 Tax=Natronomicrosphaera hydrolytica TaxID=3242702 RepID=A0ABV4U9R6_9BACT
MTAAAAGLSVDRVGQHVFGFVGTDAVLGEVFDVAVGPFDEWHPLLDQSLAVVSGDSAPDKNDWPAPSRMDLIDVLPHRGRRLLVIVSIYHQQARRVVQLDLMKVVSIVQEWGHVRRAAPRSGCDLQPEGMVQVGTGVVEAHAGGTLRQFRHTSPHVFHLIAAAATAAATFGQLRSGGCVRLHQPGRP